MDDNHIQINDISIYKEEINNEITKSLEEIELVEDNNFILQNIEYEKEDFLKEDQFEKKSGEISLQIDEMKKLFHSKIEYDMNQEKIIDNMHKELQDYKNDMYLKLVKPVLLDIIEMRDSIVKNYNRFLENPDGEQEMLNKTFIDYSNDLFYVLQKQDINEYKSEVTDIFDPKIHTAIKKEKTDDENLHGKVCESINYGYKYNDKVFKPESVIVYYFDKSNEN